jgi:hypothetical protein
MRIETPIDRQLQENRRAALLLKRQEAMRNESEGILVDPEAWNRAFERAMERRNREIAAQDAAAVVIPAGIIKRTETEEEAPTDGKLERRISRELARFLNGMSLGAVSAAVILWAILIAAGVI